MIKLRIDIFFQFSSLFLYIYPTIEDLLILYQFYLIYLLDFFKQTTK